MDAKTAVKQIRILLGMEQKPEAETEVTVQLATAKLKDGTEISYDKLEEGGVCTIGDAVAPAGDYELEDGSIVSVGDEGVITSVKPVEETAAEEEPVVEPETPEETEEPSELETKVLDLEKRIAQLEEMLAGFSTQMSTMKTDFSAQIETIANAPAAEPIKHSVKPVTDIVVDKINYIRKQLKKTN